MYSLCYFISIFHVTSLFHLYNVTRRTSFY
nr:MAG TPA: hypothetical protein [Caudoviricetes sp.]